MKIAALKNYLSDLSDDMEIVLRLSDGTYIDVASIKPEYVFVVPFVFNLTEYSDTGNYKEDPRTQVLVVESTGRIKTSI